MILIASNAMLSTGAKTPASVQFSLARFDKYLPQTFFPKSFRKIAESHFYEMTDIMTISEAMSVAIRYQNIFGKLNHAGAFEEVDHFHYLCLY